MALKNYFYDVLPLDLQEHILNIKNEEERKDKERKEEEERKEKENFLECIKGLTVEIFENHILNKLDKKNPYKKFSRIHTKKNGIDEIKIILYFKSSIFRKIKCSSYYHFKKGEGGYLKMVDFWAVYKPRRNNEEDEEETDNDENESESEDENENEN
jgi:hypothetical protein